VRYLTGASVKTDYSAWKESSTTHGGIPSTLEEIPGPEIRVGKDNDGDYSEVIVPDVFGPGSIMLFATDMAVSQNVSYRQILM
jgi:glycogen debranching enzyme